MRAILFDLDNTLYPESEFIKSGFRATSRFLSLRYGICEERAFNRMLEIFQRDGRGKVFDRLLEDLGLYSATRVKMLTCVYRAHAPEVRLYDDVLPNLENLRRHRFRLGLITDGHAFVQHSKITALGLNGVFDTVVYTDLVGRECWKPSTIPYEICLEQLDVPPSESAYVGDDVSKDFIAPNALGMISIKMERPASIPTMAAMGTDQGSPRFIINGFGEILRLVGVEEYDC
jgi:putative hydrolase of the HAD superfamily